MLLLLPFSRNLAESELYGLTIASTGTRVPAKSLVSNGVMRMGPKVDAVVIRTDSATSPLAMYVATLQDWRTRTLGASESWSIRTAPGVDQLVKR